MHSFWWLSNIPLCTCTTAFLSIRLPLLGFQRHPPCGVLLGWELRGAQCHKARRHPPAVLWKVRPTPPTRLIAPTPLCCPRAPGACDGGWVPVWGVRGPWGLGTAPQLRGPSPFQPLGTALPLRTGRRGSEWGVCCPQDCGNQQHGCWGQAGAGRWRVLRLQGPGRWHHPGHGHPDRSSGGSHCPFCFVTRSELVCEGAGTQSPWTLEGMLAQRWPPQGPSFPVSLSALFSVSPSSVLSVPQPARWCSLHLSRMPRALPQASTTRLCSPTAPSGRRPAWRPGDSVGTWCTRWCTAQSCTSASSPRPWPTWRTRWR